VATGASIDRARVHARAAANAFERTPEILTRQLNCSTVIDENDMHLVPGLDTVNVRRVHREWLTSRTPGEQSQEDGQVLEPWNQFLDADGRDVKGRDGHPEVRVALVRANDDSPGLRDGEIRTRDRRVSAKKARTQVFASRRGERSWISEPQRRTEVLVKGLADILLLEVNRW
jgi:hypothetical protein